MEISFLEKRELEIIHQNSVQILEQVGIFVPHQEILKSFNEKGAFVDYKSNIVRIPSELTKDLIQKPKKSFTIYGRDLSFKAEFGNGTRNYNTSGGQAFWLDSPESNRRYATLNDTVIATRFTNTIKEINIIGAMADPHEIPIEYRCIEIASEMIKNTNKPITFWFYDRDSARYLVDLLKLIRGGEKEAEKYPLYYPLFEPVSPLSFPFNGIDLLFETVKVNMPVQIGPMAQMGLTAPMSLAGTMVQQNAEILAGICITQLIKEGMPICYEGICHAFDMKTMQIIFGGPEQAIFGITMTQMGKYYGFPVYVNSGLTNALIPDAQAGLECVSTLLPSVIAGADIFGHMGIAGADQAASLDMLILQAEIISFVESIVRNVKIDMDSLTFDIIKNVGPKGTFINQKHTRKHFKKELWFPTLLNRDSHDNWIKKGKNSILQECRKKKEEILKNLPQKSIDPNLENEINIFMKKAKKELLQKS